MGSGGFVAGCLLGGMDANPFDRAMIHGDKNSDLTFQARPDRGQIGSPNLVGMYDQKSFIVVIGSKDSSWLARCQQTSLQHQLQHSGLEGTHVGPSQPSPCLAVTFSQEGRRSRLLPNAFGRVGIGAGRPWTSFTRWRLGSSTLGLDRVEGRARDLELLGHTAHRWRRSVGGERVRLNASTSVRPKGGCAPRHETFPRLA